MVEITQQYPNDYQGWYYLGELMGTFQQYEQAIASYDKALQLKPDYHPAWDHRGIILCDNLGRFEEAITSFEKALEIKPDYYSAWHNRGVALSNLQRFNEDIASYDKALQLKPDFHEAWNNRGIAASLSTASEGYILRVESQFIDTFQLELTDASRQLINYFQSL